MATNALSSPVEREVVSSGSRPYIVRVTAGGLYMREKGRKTVFGPVSWDFLYQKAAQQSVAGDSPPPKPKRRVSRNLLG